MVITERVQPRRLVAGTTDEDLDRYGEGEPLETALTAPLAEVAACTEETARLSEALTTPEWTAEDRRRLGRPGDQAERSLLNASNLGRAADVAKETGVDPATLLTLVDKRAVLGRARSGGLLVQGDAADGKLVLGSLFRFVAGKVDAAVAARLARLPQDEKERRDLVADMAGITAKRDEIARKGPETREENADEMARLATQVRAARDEVDFLSLRRQVDEGQEPDAALLPSASRHAAREKGTERSRLVEATDPERRGKRRQ